MILAIVLGGISGVHRAYAEGGDISIDFVAAAPLSYTHSTGGGAFNNGTNAEDKDIREELEGGDFSCSDTVSYLAQIVVDDSATDANQLIELTFSFSADSTGQSGAAHTAVTQVQINYGQVENGDNGVEPGGGPGMFGLDSGITDDRQTIGGGDSGVGGSQAVLVEQYLRDSNGVREGEAGFTGGLFMSGTDVVAVITVDNLDPGEEVILRIDTALECDPNSDPTGNLQAKYEEGHVLAANGSPVGDPDAPKNTIGSGAQTINFKQIGSLDGAGDPLLTVVKTVTTASGTCGLDDVDTLTVTTGDTVRYCYVVSNPGTAALFDVELVDDNGTPGNIADDFAVTLSGLTNIDGEGDLGDLASGATITGEAPVTLNAAGTVINTATATGNNGLSGGNFQELTDSDTATVTVEAAPEADPSLVVTKTATPNSLPEPGGIVTFTVTVQNTSDATDPVTLTSLVDNVYGSLTDTGNSNLVATDCTLVTIQPNNTYSCTFQIDFTGAALGSYPDIVTADGTDDEGVPVSGDDDETVVITDVPSAIEIIKTATPEQVAEPGGNVTFNFVVNNLSSVDAVTIDSLTDSIYGDLNGQGDCSVPQTLPAGDSYTCSFSTFVGGNAGDTEINVVTVTGTDDDENALSDTDDATVTIKDTPTSIEIIKVATPNNVAEPGGMVTFSFMITNYSDIDAVTIDSLTDSIYGDLNGQGDCSVPQTLPAGGSYTCSFSTFVGGNAGDTEVNVVTVTGTDDDENALSGTDDATVTIDDVPAAIQIIKSATPEQVAEPGGNVTFNFVVNNLSSVDAVTIDNLTDSIYGDLNGQGDCSVPQTLPAGGSYTCSFSTFVGGNAGDTEVNVVTVTGTDDDENVLSDTDDATVVIMGPSIQIEKSPDLQTVKMGQTATFTIAVTNTGDVPLANVVVSDPLSPQCDHTVAQLEVGEQTLYTCSIVVTSDFTNIATVSAADPTGNPVEASDDANVVVEQTASVGDFVWLDANANGIQDEEEPGIAGTIVTLYDATSNPVASVETDSNGMYIFPNLTPGTYSVEFTLPGDAYTFSPQNAGSDDALDSDATPDTGRTPPFTLQSGEQNNSIDTGIVALSILNINKTDADAVAQPGGTVRYTIAYSNTGTGPAIKVRITEVVPEHTSFVASASTPGWTCEDGNGAAGSHCFFDVGALAAGSRGEIEFVVLVDSNLPAGVDMLENLVTLRDREQTADTGSSEAILDTETTPVNTPTAVSLASFSATANANSITVRWVTSLEDGTWGYQVYRSTSSDLANAVRITSDIILSQGSQGGTYSLTDSSVASDVLYYYWLEEIEVSGGSSFHGPSTAQLWDANSPRIFLPVIQNR